jgi:hypothetical protein
MFFSRDMDSRAKDKTMPNTQQMPMTMVSKISGMVKWPREGEGRKDHPFPSGEGSSQYQNNRNYLNKMPDQSVAYQTYNDQSNAHTRQARR